jgi:hypothetical protein
VLSGTGGDADAAMLDPDGFNEIIIRDVFDGLIDKIT